MSRENIIGPDNKIIHLLSYLADPTIPPWGNDEFPDEMDLSGLEPFFRGLSEARTTVSLIPKEILDVFGQESGIEEVFHGEAERLMVIYVEARTGLIKQTGITYGSYSSVDAEVLFECIREGHLPVMVCHTHPIPVFFSPDDFGGLLYALTEFGERPVKATVVLLPDGAALMACSTSLTPAYDPRVDPETGESELGRVLASVLEGIEGYESFLVSKAAAQESGEKMVKAYRSGMERILQAGRYASRLPPFVSSVAFWLYRKSIVAAFEREMFEAQLACTTAFEAMGEFLTSERINQAFVTFAREMGLKLYYSEDMAHFTAFSA